MRCARAGFWGQKTIGARMAGVARVRMGQKYAIILRIQLRRVENMETPT